MDRNLLCTSNFMLAELDRVLRYPRVSIIHRLSDTEIEDFVRSIQQVALVVEVDAAPTKTSVQRMSLTIAKNSGWKLSQTQRSSQPSAIKRKITTSAKFCRHIFAHPALASLPRTYLGFHHTHQKLGLLVLMARLDGSPVPVCCFCAKHADSTSLGQTIRSQQEGRQLPDWVFTVRSDSAPAV
jgi:hypothetical protein